MSFVRARCLRPRFVSALSFVVPILAVLACSDGERSDPETASGGTAGSGGSGGASSPVGGAGPESNGGAAGSAITTGGAGGVGGTVGVGGATVMGGSAGAGPSGAAGGTGGVGGTGGASGGSAGTSGAGGSLGSGGADPGGCPYRGNVTYTLAQAPAPTAEQADAYARITSAMDEAVAFYSCHSNYERALTVEYVPSVATADGNVNGNIRFGSTASMNAITAMHEIGHTAGVGSAPFAALIQNGVFTGPDATAELRDIEGDPTAELHGDSQHFWPYGLNYVSEVESEEDLIRHCRIVMAIRRDLGS